MVTAGPGGADLLLPNNENNGFWGEVQVGQTKARGDMQFGYTFMRIEKDAVLTPFNMSDITQQSDMRGHRFGFSYAADPRVVFTVTGIITQRPTGLFGAFGSYASGLVQSRDDATATGYRAAFLIRHLQIHKRPNARGDHPFALDRSF